MDNYIRFLKDIKYDIAVSPWGFNYEEMTPTQAKSSFEWFMSTIPERISYFCNRCASELDISLDSMNFSSDSLVFAWKWFLKIARIEKTPKNEIKEMKEKYAQFGESWISYTRFSVVTEYIIRDVGIYLGETFCRNMKKVYWGYKVKPKRDIRVNRPILFGFLDTRYNPPFSMELDPIRSVRGLALHLLDHEADVLDLKKLYCKWEEKTEK